MAGRMAALSITLGAVLLVGTPLAWQHAQPPETVGSVDAVAPSESETGDPARAIEPEPETSAARELDADGATDAPSNAAAEQAPAVPTRIRIPAIDADAPLDPVGLEPSGGMEIPDDVARVGWYEPGVVPGQPGSAVLAGHVDSRTQGAGVLFRLRELDVDDEIVLEADGEEQRWRVVSRTSYPKQALPLEEIFAWDGPVRLAVITCGGEFDAELGAYEDNIVVHAVPA
jgi:sortase (surface protein transpeptidase)